jgi:putative ABC transport system permease protein
MFRHFFLISFRVFRKHKSFGLINVLGLALGIACSLLIGLFIHFEYSYDRFHENADRIYRVYADDDEGGFFQMLPYISGKFGEAYHAVPEIEACVRTTKYQSGRIHISRDEKRFTEESILAADSSFFEVFSFPLLMGSGQKALVHPRQIVISESFAKKSFGEEDPMGKTLSLQAREATQDYLVTGVMKDLPGNSRFQYDAVVSFQNRLFLDQAPFADEAFKWGNLSYETFILTKEPVADYDAMMAKLSSLITDKDNAYYMGVQSLTDIRLSTAGIGIEAERNIKTLYTFGMIALIIMFIACINFMNLSTARASTRKLEVGVRKVLGARPGQLFRQFMGEAFFHGFLAFVLAFLIADLSLPLFKSLFDLEISLAVLFNPLGIVGVVMGLLVVSFLAGAYPAVVLSNQQGNLIRSTRHASGKSGKYVRKGLVVAQFVASCLLIIGTLVIFRQMDYIQSKDLGYDQSKVVYLPLKGAGERVNRHVLKEKVLELPEVQSASCTSLAWGYGSMINSVGLKGEPEDKEQYTQVIAVEPGYTGSLGLEFKAGHGFRKDHVTDSKSGFVVNEAFVQLFNLSDPIGTEIQRNGQEGTIIGVAKDFHFLSLRNKIEPLLLYSDAGEYAEFVYSYLLVKLDQGDLRQQLDKIEAVCTNLYPQRPFTYKLQDEILDQQYREEEKLGRLMGTFSILAIVIASLGLLGLITFTAAQRTKEIGIRKVLGANIGDIVLLLTRSYALLLGIAFVIAVPLGAYFMHNWLENFAYHISLEIWIFGSAGLLAALIAGLTAGFQSYKAATINPADALRDE